MSVIIIMTLKEDLKNNYSKYPAVYFAKKYNLSINTIYCNASKLELTRGPRRTNELKKGIVNDYLINELVVSDIAKKYNLSLGTITRILKKDSSTRKIWEKRVKSYIVDETFFEKIDTPEKAYWFGFIAADGNICKGSLQIILAQKDKNHLVKLCERIGYTGPLRVAKNGTIIFALVRAKIYNDLIKLGMAPNKTFKINESIFNCIPAHLIPAAMHGYFDGDGSFGKTGKENMQLQFGLLGNEDFLLFYKSRLEQAGIGISTPKKDVRTKQTFYCTKKVGKETVELLKKFFYENEFSSKDFLDRKRERLYSLVFTEKPNFKLIHDNGEIFEGNSQAEFARIKNLNSQYVSTLLNKRQKTYKGWRVFE